tara:strand:- start:4438 stop:4569 length:132 start_codon:yes stop_codon:yes gene_type:complete
MGRQITLTEMIAECEKENGEKEEINTEREKGSKEDSARNRKKV